MNTKAVANVMKAKKAATMKAAAMMPRKAMTSHHHRGGGGTGGTNLKKATAQKAAPQEKDSETWDLLSSAPLTPRMMTKAAAPKAMMTKAKATMKCRGFWGCAGQSGLICMAAPG